MDFQKIPIYLIDSDRHAQASIDIYKYSYIYIYP